MTSKLREQKAILQAIREGNQELFNYIEDQKSLNSLIDIELDNDYNDIKDFNNDVQNLLKEIFRLFKEDEADLSNIPAILGQIMPLLILAEESLEENRNNRVIEGVNNLQKGEEEEGKVPLPREEVRFDHPIYQRPAVDPPKRIEKGPYQRPNVENIESKEIADIFCVCEYDFEELKKFINEEPGIKEKLKHFILKKLINLRSKNPHKITMRGDLKKYQIVEEINIADELGEWRFHPFFDKMAVYLVRQEGKDFPIKWHVPKDFVDLQINTKEREPLERIFSDGTLTLVNFLEDLAEKYDKDKKQAEIWAEILNGQAVDTVEELLKWEQKDFDELKSIPKQIKLVLQQELNKFKFKGMSETQANLNEAERRGIVHKIRRFLYYHAGEADKLGFINQEVLKLALDEVKTYYEGDSLLDQIKTFYLGYSVPMRKKGNIILERGMILHGPPGTGKTVLTDDLPLKMGLTPISHSLSASEVNRGIVGQTEKLLLDLCNRATKMPHLLCCVSIDEIDGLVPKRDEKSSQHKTDGIAVLLAVIGGIKDVPNLVILASTNRLNQIDDAIKRRLSGQFFVGRPSPASRRKLIQRVNDERAEDGSKLVIMDDQEVEETVKMTTNFSGAALKMLVSKLLVYYRTQKQSGKLELAEITEYATLTSKQFSIKLGTFYLPELFLKRIEDKKRGVKEDVKAQCTIKIQKFMTMKPESTLDHMLAKTLDKPEEKKLKYEFTGRILVNLSDIRNSHIEYQLKQDFQILIEERNMMASTLNDLLPRFADFVAERNIDYIQLFNSDFLLDNNAFDESKIMENINEKLQELGAYDRSLLIIDMDSLCGVNVSKSESGMGPTTSYSLSNAKLFNFGIHSISTKVQMTEKKEVWIALACKNSYLLNIAKQSLNWRKTPKQIEQEEVEKEDNTKVKICKRCDQKYLEVENKLGSCSYHDGFLFQSSQPSHFWAPLEDEVQVNALKANPKVNEFGLKYICCMENFTSQGCKKDRHSQHGHSLANYYDKFVALKRSNQ